MTMVLNLLGSRRRPYSKRQIAMDGRARGKTVGLTQSSQGPYLQLSGGDGSFFKELLEILGPDIPADFHFSGVQVNEDLWSMLHRDKNSCGASLVLTVGGFKGGALPRNREAG
jgi:hypothetical protein